MKNETMVFENSEFGRIRVVWHNGSEWFVAHDISCILGYAKTNNMNKLIHAQDKCVRNIQNGGNYVNQALINESGLYAAIFGSTLPNAIAFKHWVTSEVLPAIRKTGRTSAVQRVSWPDERRIRHLRSPGARPAAISPAPGTTNSR